MRTPIGLAAITALSLIHLTRAQNSAALGTVTVTMNQCPATPTGRTTSTLVISSTVIVEPIPIETIVSDSAIAVGTPFVGAVTINTGVTKRDVETMYLTANGSLTTNGADAAILRIFDKRLSIDGQFVSAGANTTSLTLAPREPLGAIVTEFGSVGSSLTWTNDAFDVGKARFFTVTERTGQMNLVAHLRGSILGDWTPAEVGARVVESVVDDVPPVPMPEPTAVSIPPQPLPTDDVPPVPMPSPTAVTGGWGPNGECGANPDGELPWTCFGAPDGNCCSAYGYCGSTQSFCEAGCQPEFGECTRPSDVRPSEVMSILPAGSQSAGFVQPSFSLIVPPEPVESVMPEPEEDDPPSGINYCPSATRQLTNATPLMVPSGIEGEEDFDDLFESFTSPFEITVFGTSSDRVFVSSNGVLSLDQGTGWFEVPYAGDVVPNTELPPTAILPFFEDLNIPAASTEGFGIWYDLQTSPASTDGKADTLVVEWIGTPSLIEGYNPCDVYHFDLTYRVSDPGVYTFRYYEVGNPGGEGENGATAGVGAQAGNGAVVYSTREPGSVMPGTQIVCTTAAGGTCVRSDYAE